MNRIIEFVKLIIQSVTEMMGQRGAALAAGLSYYTVLSLAPLLIILTALVGSILGQESVQTYIIEQVTLLAGEEIASGVGSLISDRGFQGSSALAALISIGVMFFSASGMFGQLYLALNIMWNVPMQPSESGIVQSIRRRLIAVLMTLGAVVLLFSSMMLQTFAESIRGWLRSELQDIAIISQLPQINLDPLLLTLAVYVVAVLVYKFVPDARAGWRDVAIGAGFTTILFMIGEAIIITYLSWTSRSIYGAASSLFAILLWVYYSAQIILVGAKFTYLCAEQYGGGVIPQSKGIVPMMPPNTDDD